ncbi:hotdog fold thioesterase [Streptomyces sp. CSDS2]|uniref:PaaI family thioesterase n=1 Tax=Streptomyces sp. CSDS2 TaxID=3055051 RepID=UPI0025B14FB3|nr:hotdog fold thioesterase [Streptomyces sp. CSDS2]MDN3259836.1 hotdog fold thioesterase [Streptomyces sp. CSDS2]
MNAPAPARTVLSPDPAGEHMAFEPPFDLETLTRPDLLTTSLGIVVEDWNPKRLVGSLPLDRNRQYYGFLHGGASAALVETLGSLAAVLEAGPGGMVLGQELSVTHHRAARGSGSVTGVCIPLFVGTSVATYEVTVHDQRERRIATGRITCQLRRRRPARAPEPGPRGSAPQTPNGPEKKA